MTEIDPSFAELQPVVEGMSPEGRAQAIVHIEGFLRAGTDYDPAIKRLRLDDGPDAA